MKKSIFKADDVAVLRFPVLSAEQLSLLAAADDTGLDILVRQRLADPHVREAIYLASPALYRNLEAWESGEGEFNGMAQTVARYLLRMAFRATPFGTFSAVASCRVEGRETRASIAPRPALRRSVQLDCSALSRLALRCNAAPDVASALRYAPNDTMFADGDSLIFTAYDRNKRGRRVYRRVEIERDPFVDAALTAAAEGATIAGIVAALQREFPGEASADEAAEFVAQLIASQVLCCDQLVDITQENPLRALLEQLPAESATRHAVAGVSDAFDGLPVAGPHAPPGAYAAMSERLAELNVRADRGLPTKVDLYAADDPGRVISRELVNDVERAVNRLVSLTRKKTKLNDFVKIFQERYGEAEVPLGVVGDQLEALGFSDRDASLPALSRKVRGERAATDPPRPNLAERVLALALERTQELYLDITALVDAMPEPSLPGQQDATLVAWFALWSSTGDTTSPVVELRSVGSQDPGRVMGRFGYGLPAITDYLRTAARASSLPVVEIVHQPEDRLGNISARPRLSDYEIRIRGGRSAGARCLALDDLTVSVVRERVVIRSRSLGTPIAVRMSNAHAYDKQGNLPLYRFLNHVSNQDYAADLLSLRRRMPNAAFVPGLLYRGMIVSRPAWRVGAEELDRLKNLPKPVQRAAFRALAHARGIPAWVTVSQADNIIPARIDNDWMLDDLLKQAFKQGEIMLGDVFPQGRQPDLHSEDGPHFHEIQIALRAAGQPLQVSSTASAPVRDDYRQAVAPLWSDWVYLKLHVPPHQQNALLAQLTPALATMRSAADIEDWFFVRYRDEQGSHLRLRLHARHGATLERALTGLRPVFEASTRRKLLHSVSIIPYVREAARYGGLARMAICERIFSLDSDIALKALVSMNPEAVDFWREAACAIDSLLLSFGMNGVDERLAFARRAAADFAAEQRFGSEERKRIGEIYAHSAALPLLAGQPTLPSGSESAVVFAEGIAPISALWQQWLAVPEPLFADKRYGVQWSLIHMRLNRLFDRDARLQEAIVWELLKRSYAAHVSRAAHAAVT